MRIHLDRPVKRYALLGIGALLALFFAVNSASQFAAALFSEKSDLQSLQRAVWLEPGNAQYRYGLGLFEEQGNRAAAAEAFRAAVELNPHDALYWVHLATAYHFLNEGSDEEAALKQAVAADPTSPAVAWVAANTYMVLGDSDAALRELRIVLANTENMISPALARCWQIKPDPNFLMRNVLPEKSPVYEAFAQFLMQHGNTTDVAHIWQELLRIHQPVERRFVFAYMQYALDHGDSGQIVHIWEQASGIAELADYQPSPENLVVNGGFDLPILDGGLDWFYQPRQYVSLSLDPSQFNVAPRSLLIQFDRASIEDAGLYHLIPVQPDTDYEFSAYYKTEDLRGAGGPKFVLQDALSAVPYFSSDDLTGTEFWRDITGTFRTGHQTSLLLLRIQRVPAGDIISGKLWIDGVQLTVKQQGQAVQ